ncbi:MAG: DUF4160 domain-containing protein [Nitrospirae bacterium]|nr:DUF4160 domain-containing protein [Nitrospirota bacterium]
MSPTVLIYGKYRFFFNSREEKRMHVHVQTADGTAKFWLEPIIALESYCTLSTKELKEVSTIIEEKQNEFKNSWKKHFSQ